MGNTADDKRKPEALGTVSTKERLFNKPYVHLLIIVIIALIAYSNTFNVPFQFDDILNIAENPIVKDLNYYIHPSTATPLKKFGHSYGTFKNRYIGSLSFALNYRLHELDVRGYHITNLAIHILNALLVYFLVMLTFQTPHMSNSSLKEQSKFIALFTALLFVSHPLQTQAVTYIVQRFASLATMFYLLSLVAYIKWRLSSKNTISNPPTPPLLKGGKRGLFIISVLSAVLAMNTKQIAFTLPVVIVLYEFIFFKGKVKKRLIYLIPLLLTMLIIPLTLIDLNRPVGEMIGDVGDKTMVQDISRYSYLLTEFRVIVTYIRLFFLPINQNLDYDYPVFHSLFNPQVFLSFLFLLSILGLGGYILYRSMASEPGLKFAAFGIFWFFVTLSVESSIIPLQVIFEHRLYLPSFGAFGAVSTGAFLLLRRLKNTKIQQMAILIFILIPLVLLYATYARNTVWRSEISLWEDVVSKSPEKPRPYYNLAKFYNKKGLADRAIEQYRIAISLNPDYIEAHNNLGNAYKKKGLTDKAIEHYKIALSISPKDVLTHNNLGNAYKVNGLIDEAIEHYMTALRLKPDYASAHNNLGNAYMQKGLTDKAIEHYKIALSLKPDDKVIRANMLNALRLRTPLQPEERLSQ